ncbi:DUF1997 domain-containing protein [Waterburya agarophytonicola K14]|uniref:DUF1997 domain-containing protein n=1 Tax=Waterburya agarophytonicola KI4 TaxID=2874699 RepID=A0A964BR37_9CYAN|nr:DUF1997 domain-containing protein [Waterburya agarophytonicola]MCC0176611.1 DUF1997 domain-containing protein [Waterburya agarophytonicola KI4]
MQPNFIDRSQNSILEIPTSNPMQLTYTNSLENKKTFAFEVSFMGRMDMYSDADTVAEYLNAHEGWFCRCAQPMKVDPLGNNGYVLTVGKYGSFGYEVEPKMGVILHPPVGRVYQMETIPIPDYNTVGYEVNYQALMELSEVSGDSQAETKGSLFSRKQIIPERITQVNWELNLSVEVEFPQFIHKLSSSLIQSTGDRLLGQIVRQVSPRLTYKVQEDFHTSHQLPIPPKSSRQLNKIYKTNSATI